MTTETIYNGREKSGPSHVRKWKWSPFNISSRKDNAQFFHWTKETSQNTYAFARFNKVYIYLYMKITISIRI